MRLLRSHLVFSLLTLRDCGRPDRRDRGKAFQRFGNNQLRDCPQRMSVASDFGRKTAVLMSTLSRIIHISRGKALNSFPANPKLCHFCSPVLYCPPSHSHSPRAYFHYKEEHMQFGIGWAYDRRYYRGKGICLVLARPVLDTRLYFEA